MSPIGRPSSNTNNSSVGSVPSTLAPKSASTAADEGSCRHHCLTWASESHLASNAKSSRARGRKVRFEAGISRASLFICSLQRISSRRVGRPTLATLLLEEEAQDEHDQAQADTAGERKQ